MSFSYEKVTVSIFSSKKVRIYVFFEQKSSELCKVVLKSNNLYLFRTKK